MKHKSRQKSTEMSSTKPHQQEINRIPSKDKKPGSSRPRSKSQNLN